MSIDPLLRQILQRTKAAPGGLEEAVRVALRRYWPELPEEAVEIGAFHRGTLHLVFDSQTRTSEAAAFLGESLRAAINEELERRKPESDGRRENDALTPASSRDALYLTRLRFHAKGTY